MSDANLQVGVRVRADGSGLVGQLSADKAAVQGLAGAIDSASSSARGLAGASTTMAGGLRTADRAAEELAGSAAQAEGAVERLTAAELRGLNAISQLAQRMGLAVAEARQFTSEQLAAANAIGAFAQQSGRLSGAQRQLQQISGQARAGMQQLSFQIGDVTQQLALGVNPAVVFAQQVGQITQAMQLMTGQTRGFIGFLAGPWGAVVTGAVTVAALFASTLFQAADASEVAATGANALTRAQSVLGDMFDLTSGRIERQNALLIANARLTAINLRAEAMQARTSAEQTFSSGLRPRGGDFGSFMAGLRGRSGSNRVGADLLRPHIERVRSARTPEERSAAIDRALRETEPLLRGNTPDTDVLGNLSNITTQQWRQALIDIARSEQNDAVAALIDQSLNGRSLAPGLRRDGRTRRPRRGRDGTAAAQRLDEFGSDAATRIRELAGQFTDTPTQITRVNRAVADLDDLLEDVQQRRPPDFQQLLAQGEAARRVIQEGINRPYLDFIEAQEESLAIARLERQGRGDEAEAMRTILQLEQAMGPLSQERRDVILASVQAIRAEQRETEILRERQQAYLDALSQTRDLIRGAITDIFQGNLRGLAQLPQRIFQTYTELLARTIEDNLFGDAFRRIEDRVNGTDIASDAAERFRDGAIEARDASRDAAAALGQLASASRLAAGAVGGGGWWQGAETPAIFNENVPFAWPGSGGGDEAITVTGTRQRSSWPTDPRQFFRSAFEELLTSAGVGQRFAGLIAGGVATAMQGAAFGQIGGGLVGMLGGRQSQTGSAIGGAIGGIAGEALKGSITAVLGQTLGSAAGPIGSIVGGILGSLAGGLLRKSKTGSATITSIDGAATTSGSNSQFRSQASGLAGNVQEALGQIAEQLGGGVGGFSVSIGIRDGKLRVDPTGRGITKTKKGAKDFGDDQAGAVAFAIADAIADGAITGLSQAVQAALRSSTDINKALREAMKVDELETLLEGTAGALNKVFKDFERQAAERVRIAQKYGFDLVKIEEINAKERAALFDQIMQDRVGSLKSLLDDLNFGDLFEGSIADQRQKLLVEVAKAEAEAKFGQDGATDRVAELRRKLLEVSREGFGTAGAEFASDRAGTISAAEEIIRLENERVQAARDAQAATNQHLATANQLADEGNNISAEILAVLRGGGGGGGAATGGGARSFTTDRAVEL